jgi:HK97 family phage major capsid protein
MGNEELLELKKLLGEMKKIEEIGFTNTDAAKAYFQEKEVIIEKIFSILETLSVQGTEEMEALKGTVKKLREELKTQAAYPRELSRREFLFNLGKGLAAAYEGNHKTLAEIKFTPNPKVDNWLNPNDVSWGEKGWVVNKAAGGSALGDPMGNMATNEQYLINPIYETEIMTEAAKKSVMMNLVRHRPMAGPSIMLPTHDRGGVVLNWLTAYGQKIATSKPKGADRVELKAYTLAGLIPFYDEFEEDIFIELALMFIEEFTENYGQEFDRQCLTADSEPFTGAMAADDVTEVTITGSTIDDLTWKDFRDAVYEVHAEERKDCCWFLNETVLNHISNIEDSTGRPIWRRPTEAMPGRLDLYPYHEVSILPQFADIGENEIFAIFMNPKRIIHGNRKGIEIKKFDGTTESVQYGEVFMRFRKRDGFLVTRPKGNMVVLKTKA